MKNSVNYCDYAKMTTTTTENEGISIVASTAQTALHGNIAAHLKCSEFPIRFEDNMKKEKKNVQH